MMGLRRAAVITVLSLLASAATASAECAWVLWVHGAVDASPYGPEPWDSFNSLEDCKRAVTTDRVKNQFVEIERIGVRLVTICLPDTVEPRGPKGSGAMTREHLGHKYEIRKLDEGRYWFQVWLPGDDTRLPGTLVRVTANRGRGRPDGEGLD